MLPKEVKVTYYFSPAAYQTKGDKLEVPIEFVLIPAPSGHRYRLTPKFIKYGCTGGYDGPNNVGIVRPFYLAKYVHCNANRFPSINVTMYQATQIASSIGGRLPTEYEWEWAAYGGEEWEFAGCTDVNKVAWTNENCDEMQKVGKLKPNGYGLFDMSGLVSEWTSTATNMDHTIKNEGFYRVVRGGEYYLSACTAMIANRGALIPSTRGGSRGFRIAMDVKSMNEAIQSGRAEVIQ